MTFLSMLQQLVAINSISSVDASLDQGNLPVIELLASWLEDLGFNIEIMPLNRPDKANLIASLGSGPGGLVLAGHTDTVPCNDSLWRSDPFCLTESHDCLYGLGVCDMKGFFPLAIEAARQFVDQPLRQPLIFLATADEESSMSGAKALASAGEPQARYAIIGEPTDMKPVHMHKGIMVESLLLVGRSGHSSNPALGRNALETMYGALGRLLDLRRDLQGRYNNPLFEVAEPTLNLGRISGGDNPNRICGDCRLDFEIRLLPGMDIAGLQAEIEHRLQPLVERDGVSMQLDHFSVPSFSAGENSPLLTLCEKLTGHPRTPVSFTTEAPFLQELGMEVTVLGPGNIEQAHQPDEHLALARVDPTVRVISRIIDRCCRQEQPLFYG